MHSHKLPVCLSKVNPPSNYIMYVYNHLICQVVVCPYDQCSIRGRSRNFFEGGSRVKIV